MKRSTQPKHAAEAIDTLVLAHQSTQAATPRRKHIKTASTLTKTKTIAKKAPALAVKKASLTKKPRTRRKKENAAHEAGVASAISAMNEPVRAVPEHQALASADAAFFSPLPDLQVCAIADLPANEAHAAVEHEVAKLIREVEHTSRGISDIFEPHTHSGGDVATSVRPLIAMPETALHEYAQEETEEPIKEPLITMTYEDTMRTPAILAAKGPESPLIQIARTVLFVVAIGGVGALSVVIVIGRLLSLLMTTLTRLNAYLAGLMRSIATQQP